MLINKLCDLYDKLIGDIPPLGYEYRNIAGCIDILDIDKYRVEIYEENDKGKVFLVPKWTIRSSNIQPNFLTDTSKYTIGIYTKNNKPKLSLKHFESFKDYHIQLCKDVNNVDIRLFLDFLILWNPEEHLEEEDIKQLFDKTIIFSIKGKPIITYEELKPIWNKAYLDMLDCQDGICSIYGEKEYIPRLHHQVQVGKEKVSLVSFNVDCVESYGFKQAYSSSIGHKAMFKYTTMLDKLIHDKRFNIRTGDSSYYIFWVERDTSNLAPMLKSLIDTTQIDDAELQNIIKSYRQAKYINDYSSNNNVYIAGLTAGKGRLAIEFMYENDISIFVQTIDNHFKNLEFKNIPDELKYPSLRTLLWFILPEHLRKRSGSNSGRSFLELLYSKSLNTLLSQNKYLLELYNIVLNHFNKISPLQVGYKTCSTKMRFIKAVLIANFGFKEDLMELNTNIKDTAYLLGRLFAILDKIQSDVVGSKRGLADKYWGKASKLPQRAFPMLFDHIHKLLPEHKYRIKYDKALVEIMADIKEFPETLSEKERGLFALGFYHQRQALFKKADADNEIKMEKED